MTPEETKAMAARIAANKKEAEAKKAPKKEIKVKPKKEVKQAKVKPTAKKVKAKDRTKPIGPGTKLFKFKDGPKSFEVCDVLNCREKPKSGFRCVKHKKAIRKEQLRANNIIWRQRVKNGTAGHHVVYTRPGEKKPIATKYSLKKTDAAVKAVSTGHSVVEKVGDFKEIVARTKKELKA